MMGEETDLQPVLLERRRTWNEHVYAFATATAALLCVSFLGAILFVVARWTAHITGVWPL